MTAATSWTSEQGNRKNRVSSDNPTAPWSDYLTNAARSTDVKNAGRRINSDRIQNAAEESPSASG